MVCGDGVSCSVASCGGGDTTRTLFRFRLALPPLLPNTLLMVVPTVLTLEIVLMLPLLL